MPDKLDMFGREEYDLLEAVQAKLVVHPLTAPILGNNHNEFRSRENPVRELNWQCILEHLYAFLKLNLAGKLINFILIHYLE